MGTVHQLFEPKPSKDGTELEAAMLDLASTVHRLKDEDIAKLASTPGGLLASAKLKVAVTGMMRRVKIAVESR